MDVDLYTTQGRWWHQSASASRRGKQREEPTDQVVKNITFCLDGSGVSCWFCRWGNQGLGRWRELGKITLLRSWVRPVFCKLNPWMSEYLSIIWNYYIGSFSSVKVSNALLNICHQHTHWLLMFPGGSNEFRVRSSGNSGLQAVMVVWSQTTHLTSLISDFQNLTYLLSQPHKRLLVM